MLHPARLSALFAGWVLAAIALGAVLMRPGDARAASSDPPTLRIHVVNDFDALALSQVRERAQADFKLCRGMLKMGDAAPPALPDAVLRKIVFWEDERLFRPDRIGHFHTWRRVQVDAESDCEPFVWVYREASVTIGCEGQTVGSGHMPLEDGLPGFPKPAPVRHEVKLLPEKGLCPKAVRNRSTDGLPAVDAGLGVKCVWLSNMMWTHLGAVQAQMAQLNPGTGGTAPDPRPGHADVCLLAKLPSYLSPLLTGRPVELASHKTRGTGASRDDGAVEFLSGNTHLDRYEEGGAVADAELSRDRVKAFIDKPWREAMPGAD